MAILPVTLAEPGRSPNKLLTKIKKICNPYGKFDTHWNYCGSTAAYNYIIDQIETLKNFKIDKINYSLIETKQCGWGDLARIYNNSLPGKLIKKCDGFYDYEIKYDDQSCDTNRLVNSSKWFYVNLCNKNFQYKKAVIFHDSFFSQLSLLFSKSFKETTFILDRLGKDKLNKEIFDQWKDSKISTGTNIVIEQWVERYFNSKGHALY